MRPRRSPPPLRTSSRVWVGDSLASRGSDNATLAAGLAQREHWWLGPLWLPLDRLAPLAGTDDDALCPVDEDEWEGEVGAMEDSIEEGWDPPPLLAAVRCWPALAPRREPPVRSVDP